MIISHRCSVAVIATALYSTSGSLALSTTSSSSSPVINKTVPGLKNGMDYITLGDSDLNVSRTCMGTMTFGQQNTIEEGVEQLNIAFDEYGINFLDTAEVCRNALEMFVCVHIYVYVMASDLFHFTPSTIIIIIIIIILFLSTRCIQYQQRQKHRAGRMRQ